LLVEVLEPRMPPYVVFHRLHGKGTPAYRIGVRGGDLHPLIFWYTMSDKSTSSLNVDPRPLLRLFRVFDFKIIALDPFEFSHDRMSSRIHSFDFQQDPHDITYGIRYEYVHLCSL